jgi:hypothetical protein
MTEETNSEYEKAEAEIRSKYRKKVYGITKKGLITGLAGFLVGLSFSGKGVYTFSESSNTPIFREYGINQQSLSYLRNKLGEYKIVEFPEYLSAETKRNLASLRFVGPSDSIDISNLEKEIKTAEKDSTRIVNTKEGKDCSEKFAEASGFFKYGLFGGIGLAIISMIGIRVFSLFNVAKRDKEIDALAEKYVINKK